MERTIANDYHFQTDFSGRKIIPKGTFLEDGLRVLPNGEYLPSGVYVDEARPGYVFIYSPPELDPLARIAASLPE